ncbi:peroxiredoxin [Paraburkholderia sp. GAS333]|uniref:redoxin domain-containing protein n=1 Tax=Paraburkholderia sp. GAS333 TaxID=3156279 RepID=UPI003D1A4829
MTTPITPSPISVVSDLKAGMSAPNFTLPATPDQKISLTELRGAPVILAFYPADWSPVCGDELGLFNAALGEFRRFGAQLVAISVDSPWSHSAYAAQRNLHFPLLADFEPKGDVAKSYGVYRMPEGICERALFVLDGEGIVRWSYVSPISVNPGVDGILDALEKLSVSSKQDTP